MVGGYRSLCMVAALLVASCGGGDSPAVAPAGSPVARVQSATLTDSALFDWAQVAYSQYFNGTHTDGLAAVAGYGTFTYRYWPATGNYVGVLDGTVYIYGPVSGNAIQSVGALTDFACRVNDCGPFTIQDVYPPDGSVGVSRATGFAATFNAPASAATVTSNSVLLKGPEGNAIPATVTSAGAGVTLLPAAGALPGDTTYTVSFAPTIQDTTGRPLTGALTKTFTTSPAAWGATVTNAVDTPIGLDEKQPAIAYDASGNILVAWDVATQTTDTLYAMRLDAATGLWSAPTTLAALSGDQMTGLNMACGKAGDCYLAWLREHGSDDAVFMARFNASTATWDAPAAPPMNAATGYFASVTPVFDNSGNLTLLVTTTAEIIALRLDTAAQAWGSPNKFTFSGSTVEAHAAMDATGNIAAVWAHEGASSRWAYGSYYNARTGAWSAEQPIADLLNTSLSGALRLALDGSGGATVVFPRGGFISEVNAARMDAATGLWGASTRLDNIDPNIDSAYAPNVVADAAGYATAIWNQNSGLWASRFSPGTGSWTPPKAISPTRTGGVSGTLLSADAAGNVTAMWSSDFGTAACRWLVKDAQWGPVTDISVPSAGSIIFTSRTIATVSSPAGNIATTWYQRNDVNGVQQHKLVLNILH